MIAGLLGATAVAAGAFGAHALAATVTPERLAVWETASQYHLIHAAVLVLLALQSDQDGTRWKWPIIGFTAGVLLFSFSLYALVLTGETMLAMCVWCGAAARFTWTSSGRQRRPAPWRTLFRFHGLFHVF